MESNYVYRVQQWERTDWKTKVETLDLDFAYEQAQQRAIITRERVRVIRVETFVLTKFF